VIIMGRKTFESIGRVLPERTNIVLSRHDPNVPESTSLLSETNLLWCKSKDEALFLADIISIARRKPDFFVIGGGEIFSMFNDLIDNVYLTEVLGDRIVGETTFDVQFEHPQWQELETTYFPAGPSDQFPSRFLVLTRRDKSIRHRTLPDDFGDAGQQYNWIEKYLKERTWHCRQPSDYGATDHRRLLSCEPKRRRFG
jgi:dihydrofolate reductase